MRKLYVAVAWTLGSSLLISCASRQDQSQSSPKQANAQTTTTVEQSTAVPAAVDPEVLNQYAGGWPDSSQRAVKAMIEKYGNPVEATDNMLVWRDQAPFKRIIVYREETTHKFPLLHKDVVEHVIDYKVPLDKLDELSRFDGSLYFDRTRGELSARCDQEAMNLLALNLADEVVRGRRSYSDARVEFGRLAMDFMNGNRGAYTEGIQFGRQINTADPDESISNKINWMQAEQERPADESKIQAQEASPSDQRILEEAQREEMTE